MSAIVPVVICLAAVVGLIGGHALRIALDDKSTYPTYHSAQTRWGIVLVIIAAAILLTLSIWDPGNLATMMIALLPAVAIGVAGGGLMVYAVLNKTRWFFNQDIHQKELERIDAAKAGRSKAELTYDIELFADKAAFEIQKTHLAHSRLKMTQDHDRFRQIQSNIRAATNAIVAANEEMRKNPAVEDVYDRLLKIRGLIAELSEDAEDYDPAPINEDIREIIVQTAKSGLGAK